MGTDLAARLLSLHEQLTDVVARFQPDQAAIEQTFVNKDGAGTLKLGQARGIALLVPAQAGLEIGEYAPNKVKKTVVGVGHAEKQQVEHMVKLQLPGAVIKGADAADALAIAICHAHHARAGGGLCRSFEEGQRMIGKLTGRVEYRAADHVLIDVRGVGYVVYCSERTLAALPGIGEAVSLYTDLLVREDLLQLFGFTSLQEKEWHRLLMSVQGIGAKASMAILGALGADGVSRAISLGDVTAIKAAKGVGPKTAQRVVIELKDKAPEVMALGGTLGQALEVDTAGAPASDVAVVEEDHAPAVVKPASVASGAVAASVQADALSALSNLGYGPGEAAGAVAQAAGEDPDADAAGLIRAALKLLAPKG